MKQHIALALMLVLTFLTSCEVIGTIFNAGVYTGIFVVLLVIAIIIWIVVKLGGRK
jgi:hypothetical protein